MNNGEGCTCNAWNETECACDADWTPKELIDARERIEELTRTIAGLRAELAQAKLCTPGRRAEAMPKTEHGPCNFDYFGVETDEEFAASGKPYVEVTG